MNRKLFLILALVLSLALGLGTTLAYLTDTDGAVNVMTLGDVSIEQHEYERIENEDGSYQEITTARGEGYEVQEFTQFKPLLPAVGTVTGWDETPVYWEQLDPEHANGYQKPLDGLNNVQDKFVLVENTGKSDAYIRTIFAFEMGDLTEERFAELIWTNINDAHWVWSDVGVAEIEGCNYYICEAIYQGSDVRHQDGLVPAGDYTYNSLAQVYLHKTATNEDMEAIDGNGNGTYDILVFSQAVQAAGFEDAETALDEAFGDTTVENHPWTDGPIPFPGLIMNADEAWDSSLENGEYTLGADITVTEAADDNHYSVNREYAIRDNRDYTLNLNGYTIEHDRTYQDGNNTGYTYLYTVAYGGRLTINGEGTINSTNADGKVCIVYAQSNSEAVINGGDFYADNGIPVWAGNGSKITINGGNFISTGASDEELIYSSGGVIDIYGGFFHNTLQENRPVNVANRNRGTGFINIYGGTFVNFDPSTGGDDPDNIKVAEGYKVVAETQENGDIWYTVVKE